MSHEELTPEYFDEGRDQDLHQDPHGHITDGINDSVGGPDPEAPLSYEPGSDEGADSQGRYKPAQHQPAPDVAVYPKPRRVSRVKSRDKLQQKEQDSSVNRAIRQKHAIKDLKFNGDTVLDLGGAGVIVGSQEDMPTTEDIANQQPNDHELNDLGEAGLLDPLERIDIETVKAWIEHFDKEGTSNRVMQNIPASFFYRDGDPDQTDDLPKGYVDLHKNLSSMRKNQLFEYFMLNRRFMSDVDKAMFASELSEIAQNPKDRMSEEDAKKLEKLPYMEARDKVLNDFADFISKNTRVTSKYTDETPDTNPAPAPKVDAPADDSATEEVPFEERKRSEGFWSRLKGDPAKTGAIKFNDLSREYITHGKQSSLKSTEISKDVGYDPRVYGTIAVGALASVVFAMGVNSAPSQQSLHEALKTVDPIELSSTSNSIDQVVKGVSSLESNEGSEESSKPRASDSLQGSKDILPITIHDGDGFTQVMESIFPDHQPADYLKVHEMAQAKFGKNYLGGVITYNDEKTGEVRISSFNNPSISEEVKRFISEALQKLAE